jgi:hypothetical protein
LPVRAAAAASARAVLNQYCVTCHNQKLKTAGLQLETIDVDHVGVSAETWEHVLGKLKSGTMPPIGQPRPDETTYRTLAQWIASELDAEAAVHPNAGRTSIHRLNRAEYTSAIRDLFALDIDGPSLLPADDISHGFDNMADALSVSQGSMERYLTAARTVSRLVVGDPTLRPGIETYRVPQELRQNERVNEDLPFGSEGGIAIRQHFPLDGEYVVRIHLQKGYTRERINGIESPNLIDVRVDGARVTQFTVGGKYGRRGSRDADADPDARTTYERTADDGLEARFQAKAGTHVVGIGARRRQTR